MKAPIKKSLDNFRSEASFQKALIGVQMIELKKTLAKVNSLKKRSLRFFFKHQKELEQESTELCDDIGCLTDDVSCAQEHVNECLVALENARDCLNDVEDAIRNIMKG